MNKLNQETSPYLLQHKDNPVNWYPWGPEAFAEATEQNKPIFLSIGYSTCYWCHVMEKDSFEKEDVAQILNEHFIAIKVDREERPDVDQIYMDAVIALTGQGGWPMSVFLTPDLKPFWGATYIPRENFKQILTKINELWVNESSKILTSSAELTKALSPKKLNDDPEFNINLVLERASDSLLKNFDSNYGGFGPAPKFPPSQQIQTLLLAAKHFDNEQYSYAALYTLENIGKRALFDHVEGGFHRYATDVKWEIPHFEKMLYDNALLIPAFMSGYVFSGHQSFKDIAYKTIEYLNQNMLSKHGYYAAEDAGDVGKEGLYYSWEYSELENLSGHSFKLMQDNFEISKEGNFEHRNTLVAKSTVAAVEDRLIPVFNELKSLRKHREKPATDTKIITSWNGLALTALCQYNNLDYARSLADSLTNNTDTNGTLLHLHPKDSLNPGKSIFAMLEDYSYLIEGLINFYQITFEEKYLITAYQLQKQQSTRLWDFEYNLFRSSDAKELIMQKFEVLDSALPSTNATAYSNLKFLSFAFNDHELFEQSQKLRLSLSSYAVRYPTGSLRFLRASYDYQKEVICILTDKNSFPVTAEFITSKSSELSSKVAVFAGHAGGKSQIPAIQSKIDESLLLANKTGNTGDSNYLFVCSNGSCSLPVNSFEDLLL